RRAQPPAAMSRCAGPPHSISPAFRRWRSVSHRQIEPVAELDEVGLADLAVAIEIECRRGAVVEGIAESDEVGLVDGAVAIGVAEKAEKLVGGGADDRVIAACAA